MEPFVAIVALVLGTVVLFKMKRGRYAWVTAVLTIWLLLCCSEHGGVCRVSYFENPSK